MAYVVFSKKNRGDPGGA